MRTRGHVGKVWELKTETLNTVTHGSLMKNAIFEQWAGEDVE